MAKKIDTSIQIQASPEKIWGIISDFNAYPKWNPFIKSITGDVRVGNSITVRLEPPGAMGMTIQPTVINMDPGKKFSWKGQLFIKGLFDGEHQFELIDNGNGSTTFIHSERFSGILIPLFKKLLDINTKNGFEAMNKKLKELAESA